MTTTTRRAYLRLQRASVLAGLVLVTGVTGAGVSAAAGWPTGPGLVRAAASCSGYSSNTTPPTTIRVLEYGAHDANGRGIAGTEKGVTTVSFRDYVRDVLPSEWVHTWPQDSLRAGAVAVKTYGWFMGNGGRQGSWQGQCFDVRDDITYQRYIPGSRKPETDQAIAATWDTTATRDGAIFLASFQRTLTGNTSEACGAGRTTFPNTMSQYGSRQCADGGSGWQQILTTYYPGIQLSAAGPSAVWSADGSTMTMAMRGANGALYVREYRTSTSWGGFTSLGGQLASAPSIVRRPGGTLDIFMEGVNGHLYQTSKAPGHAWSPLADLGGALTSAPSEVWADDQTLHLVARGANGQIYLRTYHAGAGWGAFTNLGGQILSAPSIVGRPNGWFDIFAQGTNHHLYQMTNTGGGWPHALTDLGGTIISAPAEAWMHDGQTLTLVTLGANSSVYDRVYTTSSSWKPFEILGGQAVSAPCITRRPDGTLDVFVVGTNHHLYQSTKLAGATTWSALRDVGGAIY
jgi:Stage II sporulation protein